MPRARLTIDALSTDDFLTLWRQSQAAIWLALHDLNNCFNTIAGFAELWKTHRPQPGEDVLLDDAVRRGAAIMRSTAIKVSAPLKLTRESLQRQLVSKPAIALRMCREVHSPRSIRLGTRSRRKLEILFPQNVLNLILLELVANALRHGTDGTAVLVNWSIAKDLFLLTVEDNGRPLVGDPKILVGYEALKLPPRRRPGFGGLHLIWRLLDANGGALLFSASPRLKGTRVLVRFPVLGSRFGGRA